MGWQSLEEPELAPTFPAGSQKTVSWDEAFAEDCERSFLKWDESRELASLKNTAIRAPAQGIKGKSPARRARRGWQGSPASRAGAQA